MAYRFYVWHVHLPVQDVCVNGVYSLQMLSSMALPVQKNFVEWFVIAMYCSDSGHVNVSVKVSSLFIVVSSPTF